MVSTKTKDEFYTSSIFKLITTAGLLSKYADRIFISEIAISYSQFEVLFIVSITEPPVNESYVAGKIQRGLNSVSTMVDRLLKLGLLERAYSKSDRREVYLTLTPIGREKVETGKRTNKSLTRQLTSMFDDKEVKEVAHFLNKLEEKIKKEIGGSITSE